METPNPDELFDQALVAMQANDHHKSIELVKHAIDLSPEDARLRYLLGSLYADLGVYEKALSNISSALDIDPNYSIARYHLGFMQLMSGNIEEAEKTWSPLDKLDSNHHLRLFKSGMMKIVREEFSEGLELIKSGIKHNKLNEALNNDMSVVIDNVSLSLEAESN